MSSTRRIKSVVCRDSEHRYGNKEAHAVLEDGTETFVVAWFDDELNFQPEDFIGLTVEESRDLKQKRDIEYLQS